MKAIHNGGLNEMFKEPVGNYMLKYNFESNSQPCDPLKKNIVSWELYAKVQFWKQFTTGNKFW